MKPAIVIVAYNRPYALINLLKSINEANYIETDISLVISIDYENSKEHLEVVKIVEDFSWRFGEKLIIKHEINLGLKEHVLTCGDLVDKFGSIIMLEDDLFVSPFYYTYSSKALLFYDNCDEIGGISLYSHKKNILNAFPFELIPEGKDMFFLQIASSWGQCWTKRQWNEFRIWLEGSNNNEWDKVPVGIANWPRTSWLKLFIKYLIYTNKFFAYPKDSMSTNFGFCGTHFTQKSVEYQVPLFLGEEIKLNEIKNTVNVYDSFFEIIPSRLIRLRPELKNVDFSIDLYGLKDLNSISTKFIISSKQNKNYKNKESYGLEFKPAVLNVVNNCKGNIFHFGNKEDFVGNSRFVKKDVNVYKYLYYNIAFKELLLLIISKFKKRLKYEK